MLKLPSVLVRFELLFAVALIGAGCGDDTGGGGGGAGGGASASTSASSTTNASSSTSSSASTSSGGIDACAAICTNAGFSGGTEMMFAGNVVECTCSGVGNGLAQNTCDAYCAGYGIGTAFLTSENSMNDKCVCDGTGG